MAAPMFIENIHYSKDLEDGILGACLIEKQAFSKISGTLQAECFYSEANQRVFRAISELWRDGAPVDILTVVPQILKTNRTDLNGQAVPYYVTRLTNAVVSSANIEYHSVKVREMWAERELQRIRTSPNNGSTDTLKKIETLQTELTRLLQFQATNDWSDMKDVMIKVAGHMEKVKDQKFVGIPTGFSELDTVTGGLTEGTIVIAARPSVGKSALLNSFVLHQAQQEIPVGIVSLEMPKVQIGARMVAHATRAEFWRVFRNRFVTDNDRRNVRAYMAALAELPIYISDTVGVNILDIKGKIAHLIYKHGAKIIYIDYLQLIDDADPNRNLNREQQVSKISRACKLMAMEFGIPIILLAQLSREAEKTGDKKPLLHHLRESGSIEQDADGVIFLHRDWKSGILVDEHGNDTSTQADLMVAKWRNGELKSFKIGFQPEQMRFYDPSREKELFDGPFRGGGLWQPVEAA